MSYIGNQPYTAAFLVDTKSGDGTTTAFTLTIAPANTSSCIVAITGVLQDPSTYSVSGTTLTFSAAPPSGTSNISIRYLGIPASGVTTTAYRTVTEFTATSGQTSFSVPSYTVGYIDVYRNGVMLGTADFTATTGTTVVLASGATTGDLIRTESFYVSSVLNALPSTGGTLTGNLVVTGTETVPTITSPASTALTLQTNNGTTAITVDTSQNVGIVNTSPVSYFSSARNLVVGTTSGNNGITILGGSAATAVLAFGYATGTAAGDGSNRAKIYYDGPSDTLRMSAGGSLMSGPQLVLDASGNLLVGKTSASSFTTQGLELNPARTDSNFAVTSTSSSNYDMVRFTRTGTGSAIMVGIYYNSSRIGDISISGGTSTAYNTSSDYRLKENIAPMTGALNKVIALKPCTYKWKVDGSDGEGFIAHELAEVCPHAVTGEKDAVDEDGKPIHQGIDTSFLVATLTAAIQELKAINDTQAETIAQLQADVAALKGKT